MTSPLACDLTVFRADERQELRSLARRVFDACDGVDELADGYRLRFTDGGEDGPSELVTAVVEWIALERRCCPCIAFVIEFPEDHRPMAVRMTGRPGIKPFLVAEFQGRLTGKLPRGR
ncbi:MAG TPA: hypothetical protein VKW09_13205 [bacterium]|nr:hypothetical protein [bacterium]